MTEVTTLGGGMDAHNKPGIQTKTDAKRERGDNVERPCDGCPHKRCAKSQRTNSQTRDNPGVGLNDGIH